MYDKTTKNLICVFVSVRETPTSGTIHVHGNTSEIPVTTRYTSCFHTQFICSFEANAFRFSLISATALIIIGALALSGYFPIGITGTILFSTGCGFLTLISIIRFCKMSKESLEPYKAHAIYAALSEEDALEPDFKSCWYSFKVSNSAARMRQFVFIFGYNRHSPHEITLFSRPHASSKHTRLRPLQRIDSIAFTPKTMRRTLGDSAHGDL